MAGKKRDTRTICGELCVSVRKACEVLECCRSTMDGILARSRAGLLKPALTWYREKPRSPIWISMASLEKWARERGEMRV